MNLSAWIGTRARWGILVVTMSISALGCSSFVSSSPFDPKELREDPSWIAVRDVPVERQRDSADCGTAALSMILGYWDVTLTTQELEESCPVAPGAGTKAKDLRAGARKEGLKAYLIHGQWDDLQHELELGHPLIVGLVKRSGNGAATHYEVVVALHPERKIVVTHDPSGGWRQNAFAAFKQEWESAGFLTLVFVRADVDGPVPRQPSSR